MKQILFREHGKNCETEKKSGYLTSIYFRPKIFWSISFPLYLAIHLAHTWSIGLLSWKLLVILWFISNLQLNVECRAASLVVGIMINLYWRMKFFFFYFKKFKIQFLAPLTAYWIFSIFAVPSAAIQVSYMVHV